MPLKRVAIYKGAIQDNFGLRYRDITTSNSVNATRNKPNYYTLNKKALRFGYQHSLTFFEGLLQEAKQALWLHVQLGK